MKFCLIMLIIVISSLSGCIDNTTNIEGKYQSALDPDAYLELRDGNRFIVFQENAFSGDYVIEENKITLIYAFGSFELTKKGNNFIDSDGDEWVKI